YYVYLLESELNRSYYVGQTQDIQKRFLRHNKGLEKYTKKYKPWKLLHYITLETRADAMKLEKKIKNKKSRENILAYFQQNEKIEGSSAEK
ncbi:MAG: GIY-YIG nuclease family protein, partial [Bacteroidales bacterium]|nr:GIY-YIG nuclease family protein [Bacteroidales bacterium]